MPMDHDTVRRLCRAREALAEIRPGCDGNALSIRKIARQAHISPFHFIRQFEALFGLTPHQFRMQERLDRAKQLLAMDQMPVTEVCLEVGLSSLGSFSDFFMRRVGVAPSDYRRRARVLLQARGAFPAVYPTELFPGCLTLMGWLPESAFRNFEEAN